MKNIIKKFLTAFIIVMSCAFVCSSANAETYVFKAKAWLDGETAQELVNGNLAFEPKTGCLTCICGDREEEILSFVRVVDCRRMYDDIQLYSSKILWGRGFPATGEGEEIEPVLFDDMEGNYILTIEFERSDFVPAPVPTLYFPSHCDPQTDLMCSLGMDPLMSKQIKVRVPFIQTLGYGTNAFIDERLGRKRFVLNCSVSK